MDLTRQNPTINPAYFPDTIASSYYSSITHVSEVDTPWTMHFQYGMDSGFYKTSPTYIRAVRRGQSVGLGDLDGDGNTSLTDAIRGLQITVGFKSPDIDVRVDVNGDGKMGWLRLSISCKRQRGSGDALAVSRRGTKGHILRLELVTKRLKHHPPSFDYDASAPGKIVRS